MDRIVSGSGSASQVTPIRNEAIARTFSLLIKVNVVGKVRFVLDASVVDLFTCSVCTVGSGEVPPPLSDRISGRMHQYLLTVFRSCYKVS